MRFSHRRKQRSFGSVVRIMLLIMLVCGSGLSGRSALAASDATIIVSPTNPNGWMFVQETPTGTGSFVAGPTTAPLGTGSARLVVDGTGGVVIRNLTNYLNTRLDAVTALSYSTYRTTGASNFGVSLQLSVDYDLTDTDTTFQGRLVYEPFTTGSVASGVWQTWNPLTTGKWFATRPPFNSQCSQSTPCTWAQVLANWSNAGLHGTDTRSGVFLKAGGGWTGGFDGNVDALTIGINDTTTTFNFDPEPVCTTLCYVNGTTGNDANGGSSAIDAKKTVQAAVTQVVAGGTVEVAAGTYNENITIAKSGITLRGAGAGNDPTQHTMINNAAPATASGHGIRLLNNVTGVTITQLRVQGFASSGIYATGNNNNFTVDRVHLFNNTAGGGGGGLYMNGPVSTVVITGSEVQNNTSRGIVLWNGFKQNITISNNTVRGNNCCGIELQDGTASGVTITGNIIENNGDSGIGVVGLMAGAGPNLIADNTLLNNGRFGIEVKLPNGSGAETGDGSIVVRNNTVRRTTTTGDLRDLAGIAVFRRGWVAGNNNVDIPTGVIVRDNLVSGYQQPSTSEGFGIVVEGNAMSVFNNTVTASDVGIQRQAGNVPYTPNTNIDGDQSNKADLYFGRGNSPSVCAVVGNNVFDLNRVDTRDVGPVNEVVNATLTVTNTNTGRTFCSIQGAIDASSTLDGHTISLGAGTFRENIIVRKSLTLAGASRDTTILQPVLPGECLPYECDGPVIVMTAAPTITLRALTLDGDNPTISSTLNYNGANPDAHLAVGADAPVFSLRSLNIANVAIKNIAGVGIGSTYGQPYTITNSLFENIAGVAIVDQGDGHITNNEIDAMSIADSSGILVQARDGDASVPSNLIIRNNMIRNVARGIVIERSSTVLNTTVISFNAFLNNVVAGVTFIGTGKFSATAQLNWWGSRSGPKAATNPDGTGAVVSSGVVFAPWLCDGTDTSTSIGFQPNLTACVHATRLVFSTQPSNTAATETITPAITIRVEDAGGNLDANFNGVVTLVLDNNPGGSVLSGTTTVTAVNGIATFDDLSINLVGTSYTLIASAADLDNATSNPFTITAGDPVSVTVAAGTPQSTTVNSAFGTNLQVTVRDAGNNPVANVVVTWIAPASGASGTFAGGLTTVTATTNAAGVATAPIFAANSITGTYTVVASVAGVATPANFVLTNTAVAPTMYKLFLPLVLKDQ